MFGLTPAELRAFRRLSTPSKIQTFLNGMPFNFGETCRSPRGVLRYRTALCLEGAMFAALALRVHGHKPLILDIEGTPDDDDHVVTLFRSRGRWGAISKTNHSVLRYRDPVYATVRELAMSYFHEYTDKRGIKTMRTFSRPVNLSRFDHRNWMTADGDVRFVEDYLFAIPHTAILQPGQARILRPQDPLERAAGEMREWKKRH